MKKHLLFCPGPVNVAENVKQAAFDVEIGHREKEFSQILQNLNQKLLLLYGQKDASNYQSIFITGSGTAANESLLSSVIDEDEHILTISNGEFGERLSITSRLYNKNTHNITFDWGQPFNLNTIEDYLKANTVNYVAMVHHETSTGMLNPITEIGNLCKKYGPQLIVDTVSSLGAEPIDVEKSNITFASSSAAKAIGSIPGVSMVIGRHEAFKALKNKKQRTMFLHLYKFYEYFLNTTQTPNTPAVQTMRALEQAIDNILGEGITGRFEKIRSRAQQLRSGMEKMGLHFFLPPEHMSCVLTSVLVPQGLDIMKLKVYLHGEGIIVYNGKGPLEGKIFQVGNIGEITKEDISYFLKTLSEGIVISKKEL